MSHTMVWYLMLIPAAVWSSALLNSAPVISHTGQSCGSRVSTSGTMPRLMFSHAGTLVTHRIN